MSGPLGTTQAQEATTHVEGSSSVGSTTGGATQLEQQRHTTSTETITEQLKHHWILKEHIKIDTSMLAGHIVGLWRVHPKACNNRVSHVSVMFQTWQGGMRIRASPIGTFQFGGLIGISKLPPSFITESEITQLGFQDLSAYPGIQFDPKYTEPTEWHAEDENVGMFHWMRELKDITRPEDFAGWLVMWIRSPLISSAESNSIGIQIETAGNFNFLQPAPLTGGSGPTPPSASWLDVQDVFGSAGTDDDVSVNYVQVCKASDVKSVSCGYFGARGTNNTWTVDSPTSTTHQNIKTNYCAAIRDPSQRIMPAGTCDVQKGGANDKGIRIIGALSCVNQEHAGVMAYIKNDGPNPVITDYLEIDKKWWDNGGAALHIRHDLVADEKEGRIAPRNLNMRNDAINVADTNIADHNDVSSKLTLPRQDESLVLFVNTYWRTMNIQTKDIGDQLAEVTIVAPTSQLYYIKKKGDSTPLMHIRVYSSGIITARAADSVILFSDRDTYYLEYIQDLPMNLPIPAPTQEMQRFAHKAARLTAKMPRKGPWTAMDALC